MNQPMILVTGAAGLIGSAIVWQLNRLGYENIVAVDHLGSGEKWLNLRPLRFSRYMEKDELRRCLAQDAPGLELPVIFHLGACSDTTEADATYLADNNYACSVQLAEYAARHGSRMIYASSAATYGDGEHGFADDEALVDKLRPLNMYGYSKQLFDQYLLRRGWLTGGGGSASFVGVKYSNVFGPNEYHKGGMRSMILRAYEQIVADGKVRLFKSYRRDYADGEQVRDFLYVKDAAAMTVFFMLGGRHCRGLYNVGYGAVRSWNDLARAVFSALEQPPLIEYIAMPESLQPRYQYYTCLAMEKLRLAGYDRPRFTLEAAVADYVAYLRGGSHLGDLQE